MENDSTPTGGKEVDEETRAALADRMERMEERLDRIDVLLVELRALIGIPASPSPRV